MSNYEKTATLVLKLGVGFVFLYVGITGLIHPDLYIGYFPQAILGIIPNNLLSGIYSVFEILLALWLLFGKQTFIVASILSLMLIGIMVINWQLFPILFRNVGILGATIALAILDYGNKKSINL